MTSTILPQLQSVEAELAAQEENLAAQLEAVLGKLEGIRAVIPMFSEDGAVAPTLAADVLQDAAQPQKASKAASRKKTTTANSKAKSTAKKTTQPKKTASKKSAAKKKDGRTASWQKYARPGVKNQSIPEAVRLILETQPNKEFKIADVMEALFKEGMPKSQYLKARNRISNVLSGGVRAGDWYKGGHGSYRMTSG